MLAGELTIHQLVFGQVLMKIFEQHLRVDVQH